jgi:diacylglycerol O-acyltransferase
MLKPDQRSEPTGACLQPDTRPQLDQSSAVAVLDPSAGGDCSCEALVSRVECQLAESPTLRRRLAATPPAADGTPPRRPAELIHPIVPTGAVSERALCALVGELSARPLDPLQSPWCLYVIEGLCGGLVAVALVMDGALATPAACTEILRDLLGMTARSGPSQAGDDDENGSDTQAFATSEQAQCRAGCEPEEPERLGEAAAPGPGALARRWSEPLSDARIAAYARSHLAAIDVVRRTFGGTREDVALAACTRALRRYLQAHGDPVEHPLVAALPGDARDASPLRFARLPIQVGDPVDQLRIIQSQTLRAHEAGAGAELPPHDLVFVYQEGPAKTLYMEGTPVVALHPHGALRAGSGLDLRVMRYGASIDFGLMACPDLVPDAVEIATGIDAAVADLVKRSFEEREGSLELR